MCQYLVTIIYVKWLLVLLIVNWQKEHYFWEIQLRDNTLNWQDNFRIDQIEKFSFCNDQINKQFLKGVKLELLYLWGLKKNLSL